MGQPISVVRKPTSNPSTLRFEINRTLTGMGHERYLSGADIAGDRPPDELARRLFAVGGIRSVHIYSNVIAVNIASTSEPVDDAAAAAFEDVIRQLYIHYKPGVTPSFSG